MGEYTGVKRFCELLLKEDSTSNIVKMQAYIYLAYYQYKLGDLVSAESSNKIALQLQLDFHYFAPARYSLFGLIAAARHDYRSALHFHQVAVDTVRNRRLEENEGVAGLY